jgi:hypothetical protein
MRSSFTGLIDCNIVTSFFSVYALSIKREFNKKNLEYDSPLLPALETPGGKEGLVALMILGFKTNPILLSTTPKSPP